MKSVVIGAGFGGIAAALRLRAKKHKVTLWSFAFNLKAAAIPPNPEPITTEFIFTIYIIFGKSN